MERTLYDRYGHTVAYISDTDEKAIYFFEGDSLCYIFKNMVYHWDGRHIGWFVNGIMYDNAGLRIGFIKERCPVVPFGTTLKYKKKILPEIQKRKSPLPKPKFTEGFSTESLRGFLEDYNH